MDPELDRMLTPVKVNPKDRAAREALATYLTRRNLHHDAEPNLGDPTFQGLLAAAKASGANQLPHHVFADYLEEHDPHHDDATLLRMPEGPCVYHAHKDTGKVMATWGKTEKDPDGAHHGPGGTFHDV